MSPNFKVQPPIRFLAIPRPKLETFSVLKCYKWLALDLGSKWQKSTLRSNMLLLHTSCFANVQPLLRFLAIKMPKPVTFSVPKCFKWLALDLRTKWQKSTLRSNLSLLHTSCFTTNLTLLLYELLGLQIFN